MQSMKWKKLKEDLKKASKNRDESLRIIGVVATLTNALKEIGVIPILVGGSAVTFYTNGDYTTKDIDMVAPSSPDLSKVMENLGFKKHGKDYINKELNLYIEFPSENIGPTEDITIIKSSGTNINIISLEDLIIDRLCAYKFWKSGIDGVNALRLLELGIADRKRVDVRAKEEDVLDALDYVEDVLETSIRKKLTPSESTELLEKYYQ